MEGSVQQNITIKNEIIQELKKIWVVKHNVEWKSNPHDKTITIKIISNQIQ